MWLFDLLFSSLLQLWYVEVWISQSVSESPWEFEMARVDCIANVGFKICCAILNEFIEIYWVVQYYMDFRICNDILKEFIEIHLIVQYYMELKLCHGTLKEFIEIHWLALYYTEFKNCHGILKEFI